MAFSNVRLVSLSETPFVNIGKFLVFVSFHFSKLMKLHNCDIHRSNGGVYKAEWAR